MQLGCRLSAVEEQCRAVATKSQGLRIESAPLEKTEESRQRQAALRPVGAPSAAHRRRSQYAKRQDSAAGQGIAGTPSQDHAEEERAARKIQAFHRKRQGVREAELLAKEQQAAATRIQAARRACLARRRCSVARNAPVPSNRRSSSSTLRPSQKKELASVERSRRATVAVPRVEEPPAQLPVTAKPAPRPTLIISVPEDEPDLMMQERAATKIQAMRRGHLARRGIELTAQVRNAAGVNCRMQELLEEAVCEKGSACLLEAADAGDVEICLALVPRASSATLNKLDEFGRTALHLAALRRMPAVCQALLDSPDFHRANAGQQGGWTALHVAARQGHVDVAKVLLACKAFTAVNAVDGDGRTALHCSAANGEVMTLTAILRHPSFTAITATNNGGFTALHVAERCGHEAACRAIRSFLPDDSVPVAQGAPVREFSRRILSGGGDRRANFTNRRGSALLTPGGAIHRTFPFTGD